jgi:Cft2 family RNA processing exonuclease
LSTLPQPSNDDLVCLAYGVGHGDEGVCLLVKMGPYRILLDCGLADISPLITEDRLPVCDLVLCSHAHADHARGLLDLHRTFPKLPIYTSEVTNLLLPLNWLDEADGVPQFSQALPWRRSIEFQDGLTAELFPAGHLPGAAAILLTYTGFYHSYSVFYTGDFFLSNSRLVEGLHLDSLRNLHPDVLIVEGTYGTARHPHRRQQENTLMAQIDRAITQQQSIILPVSTLGIAQELLILLRSHHLFTGRDLDIWVDGTIAAGCDSYYSSPTFPLPFKTLLAISPYFGMKKSVPTFVKLHLKTYQISISVRVLSSLMLTSIYRHIQQGILFLCRFSFPPNHTSRQHYPQQLQRSRSILTSSANTQMVLELPN